MVSFHSRQSFSVSFFHVCLGLPATYQLSKLGLVVSGKKLFHVFPIEAMLNVTGAGPFLHNLNKLD